MTSMLEHIRESLRAKRNTLIPREEFSDLDAVDRSAGQCSECVFYSIPQACDGARCHPSAREDGRTVKFVRKLPASADRERLHAQLAALTQSAKQLESQIAVVSAALANLTNSLEME